MVRVNVIQPGGMSLCHLTPNVILLSIAITNGAAPTNLLSASAFSTTKLSCRRKRNCILISKERWYDTEKYAIFSVRKILDNIKGVWKRFMRFIINYCSLTVRSSSIPAISSWTKFFYEILWELTIRSKRILFRFKK